MLNPDPTWTLFLDRDGVINQRIPGKYVKFPRDFEFENGSLEAMVDLATIFPRIVVVTNQQGVGRGLMTEQQLKNIHNHMLDEVELEGGRIDAVYACTEVAADDPICRKPNSGMAYQAKADYPKIDFEKSIIVGDSITDMEFGKRLGMTTVFVESKAEDVELAKDMKFDYRVENLQGFTEMISSSISK